MSKKKTNYQVTIGYKAVITASVKADNEEEAKKKALEAFEKYRHFGTLELQDESYGAFGVLNMDKTWHAS